MEYSRNPRWVPKNKVRVDLTTPGPERVAEPPLGAGDQLRIVEVVDGEDGLALAEARAKTGFEPLIQERQLLNWPLPRARRVHALHFSGKYSLAHQEYRRFRALRLWLCQGGVCCTSELEGLLKELRAAHSNQ